MAATRHPLYRTWADMRRRCTSPNVALWHRYGGRGISFCDEWQSFSTFVADMGPRPDGMTLDRIDNDGDYTPENCRWATNKQQQRNKSNTIFLEIEGAKYRLSELAEVSGLKPDTIQGRVSKGLTYAEVMAKTRYTYTGGVAKAVEARIANQLSAAACKKGHLWSEENTLHHKQGRLCKECYRIRKGLKSAK